MIWHSIVRYGVLAIVLIVSNTAYAGNCYFSFKGKLLFKSQFSEFQEQVHSLEAIPVEMVAKDHIGQWQVWDRTRTDKRGAFSFRVKQRGKSCILGRHVKLQYAFQDKVIEIRPKHNQTKWNIIFDSDSEKLRGIDLNLGPLFLQADANIATGFTAEHAGIWWAYKKLSSFLLELGHDYAIKKGVVIHYPSVVDSVQSSYADSKSEAIYIASGALELPLLIERMMNLWSFRRDSNEEFYLRTDLENRGVDFHLAFSNFVSKQLLYRVFKQEQQQLPFSRYYLWKSLDNKKQYNQWLSVFNMLGLRNIEQYDFGVVDDPYAKYPMYVVKRFSNTFCRSPFLSLEDVLMVFTNDGSNGYKGGLIDSQKITWKTFLNRAESILPNLSYRDVWSYGQIADVKNSMQPKKYFCSSARS